MTLWRSTWLALPGGALAALGGWRLVVLGPGLAYGNPFAFLGEALVPLVLGLLLLVAGLLPPRRVRLSAQGLRWGGKAIALGQIQSLEGATRSITVKGQANPYSVLVVNCGRAEPLELRLSDGDGLDSRVKAIAAAMNALRKRPRG